MITLQQAQYQLEQRLGVVGDERLWIMQNRNLPPVKQFWTAYKQALNFVDDTDRIEKAKKHLEFIRKIRRSGFSLPQ